MNNKYLDIVDSFAKCDKRIFVLGDPMYDFYHFGTASRLSPEAPVPIFVESTVDCRYGGAGNTLANIRALGLKDARSIFPEKPWIEKHRFIVGAHQMFRADKELDYSKRLIYQDILVDTLIISDYAKGWCSSERCQSLIQASKISVIDPKGSNWLKYTGATVICPNSSELAFNYDTFYGHIFHKLGAGGINVIYPDCEQKLFPATKQTVYDVTGAGDVVTAVVAAVLTVGGSMEDAAVLANIAAGWSVSQVGTVACTAEKLKELICELDL